MTREEAKELLLHILMTYEPKDQYGDYDDPEPYEQALTMAIEALKRGDAEVNETKSPYMQQSRHDDGKIEVVRCKDCKWWSGSVNTSHNNHLCKRALDQNVEYWTRGDDYCSYGERKGGGDE